MELNNEIRAKAKAAKTPEELIEIAKENDVEMTEEVKHGLECSI